MAKKYIAQAIRRGIKKRRFPYSRKTGSAYHWTYVLRAKDPKKRELIAKAMEKAVKNKGLSYSNTREGNADLWDKAKKHKWDISKVKRATTNCCNLVSTACRSAGIKTPRKSSAKTLPKKWKKYGFEVIPYRHEKTKLKRGDILDSSTEPKPHTAVYLGEGGAKKK